MREALRTRAAHTAVSGCYSNGGFSMRCIGENDLPTGTVEKVRYEDGKKLGGTE